MNKTDPRVIKTLHRIDGSLLENLSSLDFQKITVGMLCRGAKINRSTFYKYYKDKYDLLDSYLNRILKEFDDATASCGFILTAPYTTSSQNYIDNFRDTISFIYEHRDIYKILWKASTGRMIYQEMEDIICLNMLRTIPVDSECSNNKQSSPYYDLYSRLFASNLMTLVSWWLRNEPDITRDDIEELMNVNIKKGLLATVSQQT